MSGVRTSSPADLDIKSAFIEGCLVVVGIIACSVARWGWPGDSVHLVVRVLLITGIWQVCLYYAALYDRRTMLDRELTVIGIVQAWCATVVTLAMVYYWFPSMLVARSVILIALAVLPTIAFIQRFVIDAHLRAQGTRERILIVGTSDESVTLARELHSRRDELALEIVGFVDPDPGRVGLSLFNPSIVGTFGDLSRVIADGATDRVAISTTSTVEEMSLDEIVTLRFSGVAFDHLSAVYEEYTGKVAIEALTPMALMSSAGFKRHSWLVACKRAIDVVLSVLGLAIAGPLMLVAAAAIKLTSKGPVLYRQQRVGQDGRAFTMIKFRSMRDDAEKETGPVWASDNDGRVTAVGRVMRRTRFDELPQLWNVLRGDMSIVGPRPERPEFDVELLDQIPLYAHRRLVKPGITGWAQVRHAYVASMTDARIKLQYDLFYIKNMSIALDFLIILMTTKIVVLGRGAR